MLRVLGGWFLDTVVLSVCRFLMNAYFIISWQETNPFFPVFHAAFFIAFRWCYYVGTLDPKIIIVHSFLDA